MWNGKVNFPYGCYKGHPFSYDCREMFSQNIIDRREMFRFEMRIEQIPTVKYNFHEQIPMVNGWKRCFPQWPRERLGFKKQVDTKLWKRLRVHTFCKCLFGPLSLKGGSMLNLCDSLTFIHSLFNPTPTRMA